MVLCGDNGGIWRFLLKYFVTVHHNRLVLQELTKRWMTVSSSKLQNEQSEVFFCEIKKAFDQGTDYYVKFYTEIMAT